MKIQILFLIIALGSIGCSKRTIDMPSGSMEPTIPAGSIVTIDYSAFRSALPERFDIVAFRPPTSPNAIFAFRVVGLPNEKVQITPDGVFIDGQKVTPPNGLKYEPRSSDTNLVELNPTEYYLLGDNTARAMDSRYLGPIDKSMILGKIIGIEQAGPGYPPQGVGSPDP